MEEDTKQERFERKLHLIAKLLAAVEDLSKEDALRYLMACASIESLEQIVAVSNAVCGVPPDA